MRDRQVLGGLMRRSEVLQDEALMREARRSLGELSTPLLDAAPAMGARDMALGLWTAAIR